jgi:nucleoside-diphosphate-sugar epimerase
VDRNIRRAVVTGATGCIGMALINELLRNDISVLVLTRENSLRNSRLKAYSSIEIKYCDLSELVSINNDSETNYDAFFHLAWSGTSGDERNDVYLQESNIKYSLDAVSAAKRFGCSVFIGVGSQAEYGRTNDALRSNTPTFPETPYGIAKLCAGQLSREYATKLAIDHIWVRILSVYGPYDSKNSLISYCFRELLSGRSPKVTNAEQVWDYIHSEDAAVALNVISKKIHNGQTIVLGSGDSRRLREYIEDIRIQVNPKVTVDYGAVRYHPKQVMCLKADTNELGDSLMTRSFKEFKIRINEMKKYML